MNENAFLIYFLTGKLNLWTRSNTFEGFCEDWMCFPSLATWTETISCCWAATSGPQLRARVDGAQKKGQTRVWLAYSITHYFKCADTHTHTYEDFSFIKHSVWSFLFINYGFPPKKTTPTPEGNTWDYSLLECVQSDTHTHKVPYSLPVSFKDDSGRLGGQNQTLTPSVSNALLF